MQQDNKRHVPDWLLERLALGELDAETAADVRRRLAAEGRSPDDIAAVVAASNREILAELPATPTAAAIRRRAARAAAAARPAPPADRAVEPAARARRRLALAHHDVRGRGTDEGVVSRRRRRPEIIIAKGNSRAAPLRLPSRRRGDQRLNDGARAARGDLVQLAYGGARRLRRRAVDRRRGQGDAALARAERRRRAPRLKAGREPRCPRPTSWTTRPPSNASSWCSAKTPFSVATALEAARALAAQPSARTQSLALPPGFEQISLALDKAHAAKKELP